MLFMAFALTANGIMAQGIQKPTPQSTPATQQEKLDRGLVRINTSATSAVLSWRMLATDDAHTSFVILKNGTITGDTIRTVTQKRVVATKTDVLELVCLQNGVAQETVKTNTFSNTGYQLVNLDRPAAGSDYTYSPNDCSVGDVDGDGQYELIVKWDPSNSKDNSQSGITGNVYLDCYRIFTGEKLWRIDLGVNIRAGAHYTQFLVYDFDKDGKAELICKTAPGTLDGTGKYVSEAATNETIKAVNNATSYRTSDGRINGGHEYLTVFEGLTGHAIHTIPYIPNRNNGTTLTAASGTFNWDTRSGKNDLGSYGNRGERYLACVAYLDGPEANPSAIMCRGYYTYANLWAVDFDGKELKTHWLHQSKSNSVISVMGADGKSSTKSYSSNTDPNKTHAVYTAMGQGAHGISVGDLDGDGKDEIMFGNAAIDDNGYMLYSTGFGHGDALHLGDLDPDRPGLEFFMVHEESPYGCNYRDAGTGEILYYTAGDADNGRGCAADVTGGVRGAEFWSANVANTMNVNGAKSVSTSKPSMNFRIFWDGDPYEELLDGTNITKWATGTTTNLGIYTTATTQKPFTELGLTPSSCNSTKSTPCLQADIFGDWREEVIWWNKNNPAQIYIVSSTTPTNYRVPTLMHDHLYRMGVAWQNCAYNQPPHLGYYLPDFVKDFAGVADDPTGIESITVAPTTSQSYYNLAGQRISRNANKQVIMQVTTAADGSKSIKKVMK